MNSETRPDDPTDRAPWVEERRGAMELLAALAEWDSAALRQAAITTDEGSAERDLLLEAATIRR